MLSAHPDNPPCRGAGSLAAQILGQGMQLVDMIGRGIAREANQVETALPHVAELLRAHGPPTDHLAAVQPELFQ